MRWLLSVLVASATALDEAFQNIIDDNLHSWRGSTVKLDYARQVASEIGVTMFKVDRAGVISFEAGLNHRQRQWQAFFERILPSAVRRADRARFPIYLLFHGWDEPVGRVNEAICNASHGHLHANLWNPHVGHVPLPFLSVTKVRTCARERSAQ